MLISDRIQLTLINQSDEEFYLRLYSDPELMQYIMPLADKQKSLKSFKQVLKRLAPQNKLIFIIRENKDPKPIGMISLSWVSDDEAELGTVIIQRKQRNGYAREARKLLILHAFKNLNLKQVVGYTDANNQAINDLNQKLGSIKGKTFFNQKRNRMEIKWIILPDNFLKANRH